MHSLLSSVIHFLIKTFLFRQFSSANVAVKFYQLYFYRNNFAVIKQNILLRISDTARPHFTCQLDACGGWFIISIGVFRQYFLFSGLLCRKGNT